MTPEEYGTQIAHIDKPKKRLSRKLVALILGAILVVLIVAVVTALFLKQEAVGNNVKNALATASAAMTEAKGNGGGYPTELPANVQMNKDVQLSGGGSFDGTTYCVTGISTAQPSVVYYIDSSSKQPQKGSCQSAAGLPVPTTVSSVQQTIVSSTQIGVGWTQAIYALNYTVQCATDQDFKSGLISSTGAALTGTCDNTTSDTQYYVRVRGNNNVGAGPWSPILSVKTGATSVAPTNVVISAASATQINYSWSPVNGAKNYVVQWASDINFSQDVETVTQSGTSGSAKKLKPDTTYFFHVKAVTTGFSAEQAAFSDEIYTKTPAS